MLVFREINQHFDGEYNTMETFLNPPLAEMGSKKTPGRKMAEKRYKEDQKNMSS